MVLADDQNASSNSPLSAQLGAAGMTEKILATPAYEKPHSLHTVIQNGAPALPARQAAE